MHIPIDKSSLRRHSLNARQSVDVAQAQAASAAVAKNLLQLISKTACLIAGYRAIGGELDISQALEQLSARGHMLCLPVVAGPAQPLLFRRWQPGEPLEKGAYGVEVPQATAPQVMPDVLIVPLLAFDGNGHRLGYGAGFYDRSIAALRQSQKGLQVIGAAYSLQQVEKIPHDGHDQKLDAVVTEKEVIRFA